MTARRAAVRVDETEESKAGWSRRRCNKGESAGETGGIEPYRKGQTVGHVEQVATLAKADPETWIVAKTFCSFLTK